MPRGSARAASLYMGGGGAGAAPSAGWSIVGASYDSKSFSVSAQESSPTGIAFRDNGTTMYVAGSTTDDVFQYTLSTAWDVSTATYASKSYAFGSVGLSGLSIAGDGTYMYATFQSTSSNIRTVKLNTAWDLGSVSSWNNYTANSSQDTNPRGIFVKPDYAKFYVGGDTGDSIYQYDITTDGASGIFSGNVTYEKSYSIGIPTGNPHDVFFKPDGTVMFILRNTGTAGTLIRATLTTPWDIATAGNEAYFSLNTQTTTPTGFWFKPDGMKVYVVSSNGTIYQYSLT